MNNVDLARMALGGGGVAMLLYQFWPAISSALSRFKANDATPDGLTVECVLRVAAQLEAKNQVELADKLRKLPVETFSED